MLDLFCDKVKNTDLLTQICVNWTSNIGVSEKSRVHSVLIISYTRGCTSGCQKVSGIKKGWNKNEGD